MYKFVKIDSSQEKEFENWESFNQLNKGNFLTSSPWLKFQIVLGKKIELYKVFKEEELCAIFPIEIYSRKIARYAYSPYSPVINSNLISDTELDEFLLSLKDFQSEYIKNNNLNLFRMDPFWDYSKLHNLFQVGYKRSLAPTQAKDLWEIDISGDEDSIFSKFKTNKRYAIRNLQKLEIKFRKVSDPSEIELFYKVFVETQQAKNFSSHPLSYFVKQFETLNQKGMSDLYLAEYQGKVVSGAFVNKYLETGYYSHSGSTTEPTIRKLGIPDLLQWEIIKDLKKQGFKRYNMWGVLPDGVKNNMYGVSEFKKRFGGYMINVVGGVEIRRYNLRTLVQLIMEFFVYRNDRY